MSFRVFTSSSACACASSSPPTALKHLCVCVCVCARARVYHTWHIGIAKTEPPVHHSLPASLPSPSFSLLTFESPSPLCPPRPWPRTHKARDTHSTGQRDQGHEAEARPCRPPTSCSPRLPSRCPLAPPPHPRARRPGQPWRMNDLLSSHRVSHRVGISSGPRELGLSEKNLLETWFRWSTTSATTTTPTPCATATHLVPTPRACHAPCANAVPTPRGL